jgi:hypothetical protein
MASGVRDEDTNDSSEKIIKHPPTLFARVLLLRRVFFMRRRYSNNIDTEKIIILGIEMSNPRSVNIFAVLSLRKINKSESSSI